MSVADRRYSNEIINSLEDEATDIQLRTFPFDFRTLLDSLSSTGVTAASSSGQLRKSLLHPATKTPRLSIHQNMGLHSAPVSSRR